ncbi:MAG: hypothetical protein RR406_05405 [Bacilli bacterium]
MKKKSTTINTITGRQINEQRTYDDFSNLIKIKSLTVDKEWKYDKQSNPVYHKDNITGFECWREYDKKGHETLYYTNNGFKRCQTWNGDMLVQVKDNKGNNIKY